MARNYQLSHLRPCQEPNPGVRGGRQECYPCFSIDILGSSLCPAVPVKNFFCPCPSMFRISAKAVLCNSVTLDMSGSFLLVMFLHLWPMLLLVVSWITVTRFSEVSPNLIYINYSALKKVQPEFDQTPVDTLV